MVTCPDSAVTVCDGMKAKPFKAFPFLKKLNMCTCRGHYETGDTCTISNNHVKVDAIIQIFRREVKNRVNDEKRK